MHIHCRPMVPEDYGLVESVHWTSVEQVRVFVDRQGIASMLAFDGARYVGQLYLQEYDPGFADPGGWTGHRPWADFRVAEPLPLEGRYLTLGCYHVGWLPDGSRRKSLWGRGIGTALLREVVTWYRNQSVMDGLLTWAVVPGSRELLQEAGQMPHTVYERFGFREVKQVHDPRWAAGVARFAPSATGEGLAVLRVMLLARDPSE